MKQSGKWHDFLFTLAVRAICGVVMGVFVGFLLCAPVGRRGAKRPLVVWLFGDTANPNKPYYWFSGFGLIGAAMAMLTTPKWQTPWYKRTPINLVEGFSPLPEKYRKAIDSIEKTSSSKYSKDHSTTEISQRGKAVITRTVGHRSSTQYKFKDESGMEHIYHSLEEMPPELRDAVIAAKKESKT